MVSEIFNEDCMVGMARYPDKFFDLAVVDPPYGIGASSKNFIRQGKQTGKSMAVSGIKYTAKDWDAKPIRKKIYKSRENWQLGKELGFSFRNYTGGGWCRLWDGKPSLSTHYA